MKIARCFGGAISALLVVWCTWAVASRSDQGHPTLWAHNGSVVYLIKSGKGRAFHYQEPRAEMIQAGAHRGALLFTGQSNNHQYTGTAFVFNSRCGQLPYHVSGPIRDDHERVQLKGRAPRVGSDCQVIGYVEDTLDFELIKGVPTSNLSLPPLPHTLETVNNDARVLSAPLKREGGTFLVPILINKAIVLDFVVDSGAADVSITQDVFLTLVRTGTIQESDLTGKKTYTMANGSAESLSTFKIRSLTLGGTTIENVDGSVSPVEGSLLLGQSFLSRFKSWSLDNAKGVLALEPYSAQTENTVLYAPSPSIAPVDATKEEYSVVKNLNMREFPDPKSPNALTHWEPEDFVPQGTTFRTKPFCTNGPTGYIWCRVTFQHHNTQTSGWVAGYYLWSTKDRRRVACLYPSPDPDCTR
jgi:clan AA aspartic protease (TIGR02281 family)